MGSLGEVAGGGGLVGRLVEIVFSDPWEFARADGTTRFQAVIKGSEAMANGAERDGLLIRLIEDLDVGGMDATWFFVRARRGSGLLQEISFGEPIAVNLVVVPAKYGETFTDFGGGEGERGGLAAIGTVELR